MLQKINLVSLVFPVFNEAENIPTLFKRLEDKLFKSGLVETWELVFVDDGSMDRSVQLVQESFEAKTYDNVNLRILSFSRNFGHQIAITAGIDASKGDFVVVLDADLQDPPELVLEMLKTALEGFEVVYGKRKTRSNETVFKKVSASLFYRLINKLSDVDIPVDTGDFRLMSRKFVDEFIKLRERHRYVRGMVPWLGFRSTAYEFDRDPRSAGVTKYPLNKMISFAMTGIISFSTAPLRLAVKLGLLIATCGALGICYIVFTKLVFDNIVDGFATIVCSIALFGGVQLIFLGLIGEYVGRIFEEIKGRPLYVISTDIEK